MRPPRAPVPIEALTDRKADSLEGITTEVDNISRQVFRKRHIAGGPAKAHDFEGLIMQIGSNGDLLTKVRESLGSIHRLLTFPSDAG